MSPENGQGRPGGAALGKPASADPDDSSVTPEQRSWRDLFGPAMAEARARSAERRIRVLAHPDLAARLTHRPLGYDDPHQWSGYVPPRTWHGKLNTAPQRQVLVDICAEALRRDGGDRPALDVL